MTEPCNTAPSASRRHFLIGAAGVAGVAGVARPAAARTRSAPPDCAGALSFYGVHQGGIATPQQAHTYFAAFDVTTERREDLIALMRQWTDAAARMTEGLPAGDGVQDPSAPPIDTGESDGLGASRLTLTFGFGPTLFSKDGVDRFGLAARRPAALVDLPRFVGDQLVAARTGGDFSVQACADDPR